MVIFLLKFYALDISIILLVVSVLVLAANLLSSEPILFPCVEAKCVNSNFDYPIRIDGHWFYPEAISTCIQQGNSQASNCSSLFDKSLVPYEEIPDYVMVILLVLGAATLVSARCMYWLTAIQSHPESQSLISLACRSLPCSSSGSPGKQSLLTAFIPRLFLESALFVAFSVATASAVILLFKEFIQAPRPINRALTLWSSIHPGLRSKYASSASLSHPSGHAGSAAAVFGSCLVLLAKDSSSLSSSHPALSRVLMTAVWGLFVVIVFIGSTRIKDFWHTTGDVVDGYVIGAVCVALSYQMTSKYPCQLAVRAVGCSMQMFAVRSSNAIAALDSVEDGCLAGHNPESYTLVKSPED